jgi:hypothetical protein
VQVIDLANAVHSDSTGRFRVPSWRANNNLLVAIYKGYIFGVAYIKAYETLYTHLRSLGHAPAVQRLDNETRGVLKRVLKEQRIKVEYVPVNSH